MFKLSFTYGVLDRSCLANNLINTEERSRTPTLMTDAIQGLKTDPALTLEPT